MWKGSLLKISYLFFKKKVYTCDDHWFYYVKGVDRKCVDIGSV